MSTPNRPRLHPWLPLLRLRDGRLTIATGPRAGLGFTARDSDAVRAAARAADGLRTWAQLAADPAVARGLTLLWQHGALIDCDHVVGHGERLDAEERRRLVRAQLSRLATPRSEPVHVEARRDLVVAVSGPLSLVDPVCAALTACGVGGDTGVPPRAGGRRVDVVIGRPDWTSLLGWMVDETPHLVISPRTESVRVGPLVVPGQTSCLQCLHLVRCDRHPDWPLLWEQLRDAAIPEPDPALMQHAAAVAARCLVDFAERGHSAAVDAWLEVATADLRVGIRSAPRHPLCACWCPAPAVAVRS